MLSYRGPVLAGAEPVPAHEGGDEMDLLAQSSDGGGSAILWLLYVAFIVVYLVAAWIVYTKAGEEGWKALIPIYNVWVLLKIVGRPGWWLLLFLIPFVNCRDLGHRLDRPGEELRQGNGVRARGRLLFALDLLHRSWRSATRRTAAPPRRRGAAPLPPSMPPAPG